MSELCFLCGSDAEIQYHSKRDVKFFDCPKCGVYGLSREAEINNRNDPEFKQKASYLIKENNLNNEESLVLSSKSLGIIDDNLWISTEEFLSKYPSSVSEVINRVLLNLSNLASDPSSKISLDKSSSEIFFTNDINGIFYLLRYLHKLGYITPLSSLPGEISIEPDGLKLMN